MSTNPYGNALGERDAQQVIDDTPARLARLLDRLSAEQVETPPAPGKWSVRELVCHLADCEIAWAWRLRFAYEQEHPVLQPFEQDPWARMYGNYSLARARATFEAVRAWNVAFVGGLTEADKRKPVNHPEYEGWTLWTIVEMIAGHDLHHLKMLELL